MCVCGLICSRSGVIEKLEALELENPEKMEVEESGRTGARQGRSEHRRFQREVTPLGETIHPTYFNVLSFITICILMICQFLSKKLNFTRLHLNTS